MLSEAFNCIRIKHILVSIWLFVHNDNNHSTRFYGGLLLFYTIHKGSIKQRLYVKRNFFWFALSIQLVDIAYTGKQLLK